LLRHGESENNVLNLISKQNYRENRFADPALTKIGEAQAQATANYLSGDSCHPLLRKIDRLIVSPFLRTCQTALPISSALGKEGIVWPDIYEVSGAYEGYEGLPGGVRGVRGLTGSEIKKRFGYQCPVEIENGWNRHEGRESYSDAVIRIAAVASRLRELASQQCSSGGIEGREAEAETGNEGDPRETICMVVHGDFIDILLNHLMGMPCNPAKARFRTYNTSISVIDIFHDGMVAALFTNFHEHLEGGLVKRNQLGVV